jgi:hypothetical protein
VVYRLTDSPGIRVGAWPTKDHWNPNLRRYDGQTSLVRAREMCIWCNGTGWTCCDVMCRQCSGTGRVEDSRGKLDERRRSDD